MSYRDDLDAALMRADAAERETRLLRVENERLAADLATASEWLGGPRRRLCVAAGVAVAIAGCVPRSDGVQLTAQGSEDYSIWLTNNVVEVETPNLDMFLDESKHCRARFGRLVERSADNLYSGHVELDCQFHDNRLIGRIEFRNCR